MDCCAFLAWRISCEGVEDGDTYTILRYLALIQPQRANDPDAPFDKIVFTPSPRRFSEAGWAGARVLGPRRRVVEWERDSRLVAELAIQHRFSEAGALLARLKRRPYGNGLGFGGWGGLFEKHGDTLGDRDRIAAAWFYQSSGGCLRLVCGPCQRFRGPPGGNAKCVGHRAKITDGADRP